MRRQFPIFAYVIFALIAIGIFASIRQLVIPIIVFGVIILLYLYPPNRWRFGSNQSGTTKRKTKTAKFRVIKGNKKDEDDTPRYH